MSELDVRRKVAGPGTYHLELYNGDTHIGDYERSKESEIPRKLREIVRSTDFLLGAYANFGKFAVRWNGRERVKEVRKYQEGSADPGRGSQPLAVIPREYWAGEGVRRQALAASDVPDTGNVEPKIVDISNQRIQIMPKGKVHTIPQGSIVAAYFLDDGTEVFKAYRLAEGDNAPDLVYEGKRYNLVGKGDANVYIKCAFGRRVRPWQRGKVADVRFQGPVIVVTPHEGKEQPGQGVMGDAGPPPRAIQELEDNRGREEELRHTVERRRRIEALLHRDAVKDEINHMSGVQFEEFVADIFRQQGYFVRTTARSGDQGVDLLLDIEGRKVAVQLKRWVAPVGNKVVSHTLGGMLHYGAQEAWVVTTGSFTPKAREMARSTGVRLIDGAQLAEWLEGLSEEE